MSDKFTQDPDQHLLNSAIGAVKSNKPSREEMTAAGERVRAALDNATLSSGKPIDAAGHNNRLGSTEAYIAAIPDYLKNRLSPAQKLLFEEETRQSIPFRRALNEAKLTAKQQIHRRPRKPQRLKWFFSTAAAVLVAVSFVLIAPQLPSINQSQLAQVEDINGTLYQVMEGGLQELQAGAWIDGRQLLRTAYNTSAMLVLDDGSRVEVSPRAELQLTRRGKGNRIDVDRGKIIVEASPQGSGTLDVATNEFVVSVTGTIFEVGHGANGSRVSVIEGEVHVHQQGDSTSVMPGEQFASRMGKSVNGVEGDIAWSRNADEYIAMLQAVNALQQDIEAAMATEPRYSTRLLNLVPKNTIVYGAVPNAPEKMAEVYEVIRDRVQQSEIMSRAFARYNIDAELEQLEYVMNWLGEVGDTLGDETVAALVLQQSDGEQENGIDLQAAPIILSEVDAEAFRDSFTTQLESLRDKIKRDALNNTDDTEAEAGSAELSSDTNIVIIDHPSEAVAGQLSIWLHDDLLVASTSMDALLAVETAIANNGSAFIGSGLHTQLVNFYNNGAEFLGAVDLERLITTASEKADEKVSNGLDKAGLGNVQYLMVHHGKQDGRANFTADLLFNGERTGLMSWLAEPASMGSLDFFSGNTTFVAAGLSRSPVEIFEEIKQFAEQVEGENGDSSEVSNGGPLPELARELRDDFIAALGGEIAFGMDGPALPTPSWKVVAEVYDQVLLQETLERFVEVANQTSQSDADLTLSPTNVGAYNAYQFNLSTELKLAEDNTIDTEISFIYAYVDGYWLAAPNAALLERAILQYHSGVGLLADSEFQSLLPQGGYLDVSALSFNRVGQLLSDLTKNLPSGLSPDQQDTLRELRINNRGASMMTVIGEPDSIRFVHSGSSLFSINISSLLSMQSLAGILIGEDQLIESFGVGKKSDGNRDDGSWDDENISVDVNVDSVQ